ncbi:MAG: hypothetical protein M3Z54_01605 [Gemmatimonadota bacterium]|nr:hypothetical protein [Gemmatimonadota bacterium]
MARKNEGKTIDRLLATVAKNCITYFRRHLLRINPGALVDEALRRGYSVIESDKHITIIASGNIIVRSRILPV